MTAMASEESVHDREYKIKAAFLGHYFSMIDWPQKAFNDKDSPFVIGILGEDPFGTTIAPVLEKTIKGRKIVLRRFGRFKADEKNKNQDTAATVTFEDLRSCHILFICSSERESILQIIEAVKSYPVLTVGDAILSFIENQGILNFIPWNENKIGFEVNIGASKNAGLKINSEILRVAKRRIEN